MDIGQEMIVEQRLKRCVGGAETRTTERSVLPVLADAEVGTPYQFTRLGYFTADSKWAQEGKLVFNRAVTLKDGWKG